MLKKISLNEASNLTGIAKTSIRDWMIDDNPEYQLISQERKEGARYSFNEKDIEKIVVFYIYKTSQTIAPSQEKGDNKKRGKETKELIKEFNKKYNVQEPLEILSEISKTYHEIYYLFKESKETNSFDEKVKKYVKMIALISINLESKLSKEVEIRRVTVKTGECNNVYEYDRVLKGEEIIATKFSDNTINKILAEYRKPYSHYFEENNLDEYTIIDMARKPETSQNTKLLKEYWDYFNFFPSRLKDFTYEQLLSNGALKDVKKEFCEIGKSIFEKVLDTMGGIISELEIVDIYKSLEPINKRMRNLSVSQKEFYKDLQLRNYSDMFMCIDEVLDFYNSPQGKLLNKYFKLHNLMVEFFNYVEKFSNNSNHYRGDIKLNLTRDIKFPMRCLGYDYEYKYHMLHDAFELMQFPEKMKKGDIKAEKLLEAIPKILSHGSFEVNSYYKNGKLLQKAIATNNPEAVKVLNGYIDEVEEDMILSACYDHADTEGMIRSVLDCISDRQINIKAYYQAIYEGNPSLAKALLESVEPISKKYSIEMYLCIAGTNPKEVSKVLMDSIDKSPETEDLFRQAPTREEMKLSFIEVSVLWGREAVVRENIDFLNSVDRNNPLLEKILALLLRRNYVDTFKEVFVDKGFDSSRIFYIFIDTNGVPSTEVTEETWKYMLEEAFIDIDTSKVFSNVPNHCHRPHEATIEGLAKENFHFTYASMGFLERLCKETTKFKMAFKDVTKELENNPEKSALCYMGLEEEYENNPEEYLRKREEEMKMFQLNWSNS